MFLFAPAALPRAYVFTMNNAHFKLQSHLTGILENIFRRHVTSFEIELIIIHQSTEGNEMVSATNALGLAKLLKNFSKYRTVKTAEGTSLAVVAFEVGRAHTYASDQDTVVVLHDTAEQGAVLDFLSQQRVSGRKVHVVNIRDYLMCHSGGCPPLAAATTTPPAVASTPVVPSAPSFAISHTDTPR